MRIGPEEDSDQVGRWLAEIAYDSPNTESVHILGWRLEPVSQRMGLGTYLRRTWERRHFILADAKGRAFQSSRGTFLGRIWLIVAPFLNSLVYYLIFGIILQTSRGVENFPAYLVIGVNFFAILRNSLTTGSAVMNSRGARNLTRAFSFPRVSIMLSWALRQQMDFLPIMFATLVFVVAVPPHAYPTLAWLLVIPVVVLGFVLAFGLSLITTVLTSILPDLKFIWPLVSRFWFYISGVFFSLQVLDGLPRIKPFMEVNPAYVFLTMCRDLLIYKSIPSWSSWFFLLSWAVLVLGIGFLLFWLREDAYGRER